MEDAVNLLSQQLWCWGRDILRPEGNWLLETGFARTPPPPERRGCNSLYKLRLSEDASVVLQGFGVFYGAGRRGGIFLPRYEFKPLYTSHSKLETPPWTGSDLSPLRAPGKSRRFACVALTLELIDWIRSYELNVLKQLGVDYRRSTLAEWDDGERPVVPAEEMARAWRMLGYSLAENARTFV